MKQISMILAALVLSFLTVLPGTALRRHPVAGLLVAMTPAAIVFAGGILRGIARKPRV